MGILKHEDVDKDSIHILRKWCEEVKANPGTYTQGASDEASELLKQYDASYVLPDRTNKEKIKKREKLLKVKDRMVEFRKTNK